MRDSSGTTRLRQRRPRLKLDPKRYAILRKSVLKRDGWRCQECGAMENLHVHHIKRRSQLGDDATENLITLCSNCHSLFHGHAARY